MNRTTKWALLVLAALYLIVAATAATAPRLIGFGCREGASIQMHDEEDQFPICDRIEPL